MAKRKPRKAKHLTPKLLTKKWLAIRSMAEVIGAVFQCETCKHEAIAEAKPPSCPKCITGKLKKLGVVIKA